MILLMLLTLAAAAWAFQRSPRDGWLLLTSGMLQLNDLTVRSPLGLGGVLNSLGLQGVYTPGDLLAGLAMLLGVVATRLGSLARTLYALAAFLLLKGWAYLPFLFIFIISRRDGVF